MNKELVKAAIEQLKEYATAGASEQYGPGVDALVEAINNSILVLNVELGLDIKPAEL